MVYRRKENDLFKLLRISRYFIGPTASTTTTIASPQLLVLLVLVMEHED
jgi:hypothetical protein